MKEKLFSLVLSVMMVISSVTFVTNAAEPTSSTGLKITDYGTYCGVSGLGTCTDKDVVIPSTYNGKPITSIDNYAFYGFYDLTSIIIPEGVTSIGIGAFSSCRGLTSITLPEGITSIGARAFSACVKLTSITIPESVTTIGDNAFEVCTGLTSITIPENVTTIGVAAFDGCSGLTGITIPANVSSIGRLAFYRCDGLETISVSGDNPNYHSANNCLIETATGTLVLGCKNSIIPDDGSVTAIGEHAFGGCSGLTNILIPESVTSVGNDAFINCSGLTGLIIPESVTTIGEYAFYGCSGLKSITIPEGVTAIDEYTFFYCSGLATVTIPRSVISIRANAFAHSGLTSIKIPGSVTSVGDSAFLYCSKLSSIIIPKSVTTIGNSAFYGCSGLEKTYYLGKEDDWKNVTVGINNSNLTDCLVFVSVLMFADDSGYSIVEYNGHKYTSPVGDGTTVGELLDSLIADNIAVYSNSGKELGRDDKLGTGATIVLADDNGDTIDEVVVVIRGDVDGDGEVTSADALRALNNSSGLMLFDDCYVLAADIDGNGHLSSADVMNILKYSAGLMDFLA